MTTLEIAQKYGVPTPETCKELDWKVETNFYWHIVWKFKPQLVDYGVYTSLKDMVEQSENETFIPAPQIHEIAPLLPQYLKNFEDVDIGFLQSKTALGYPNLMHNGIMIESNIQTHHYAEAYAQLYIKLKNENLL